MIHKSFITFYLNCSSVPISPYYAILILFFSFICFMDVSLSVQIKSDLLMDCDFKIITLTLFSFIFSNRMIFFIHY